MTQPTIKQWRTLAQQVQKDLLAQARKEGIKRFAKLHNVSVAEYEAAELYAEEYEDRIAVNHTTTEIDK